MHRRLEELDRLDRDHPDTGRHRRSHGPVLPGLAVVVALLAVVTLQDPGASVDRLRGLLGIEDRLASVVQAPVGGGHYRFSMTQHGSDRPVSWNPCRPIRYVVNPEGGPERWYELVQASVDHVADATGFVFDYQGTTDDRDFDARRARGGAAPVLIGWANAAEVPGLAGDVAGLGGAVAVETSPGRLGYVTGMVALDTATVAELAGRPDAFEQQRAILDHELAHVVGLDHVADRGELMHEENLGQAMFGPGDLTGLAALGAVPCG